ncbi:MAG: hypothetical protein H6721_11975 [Sandaracinus sp.]|nr:hypothetical protein [Sandaracinus sp.]
MAHVLAIAFYAVTLGAVAFFVHKVLWFLRYRKLQEKLVARALERLTEQADTTVVRWDQGAEVSWSEASRGDSSPTDYVRKVEDALSRLDSELVAGHEPLSPRFLAAVLEPREPELVNVLRVPQRRGGTKDVSLLLHFPTVPEPVVPPESTFALEVRSRYGFGRRLLAFFFGAADVVYSSQHVVRMSQDPNVPKGLLLRRISLVLLILMAFAVDIGFGVRHRLVELAESWLRRNTSLLQGELGEYLPSAVGLGLWLAGYGALYLVLFFVLRRKSLQHVKELELLRASYKEKIADLRDEHLGALARWARDYGRTLDDAVLLARSQAQLLVERARHRLRRRVASPRLLDLAGEVARCFFAKLPESATNLEDVATMQKHSFAHSIWPRATEMKYQVEIAKYRHAWRDVERCLGALRGEHPDPDLAGQLWRSLVRYARMFPEVVPEDLFTRLQEAHGDTVGRIVRETEADLVELDEQLGEVAVALTHTIEAVPSLVETRVELTTQSMNAAVARFVGDALRVREQARLEAMAFEI